MAQDLSQYLSADFSLFTYLKQERLDKNSFSELNSYKELAI